MTQYFAASLRRNGGNFADARLIVHIGDDSEPFDVDAALPDLACYGITWRWVDRAEFQRLYYNATGLARWAEPFQSEYVLMADADMLVAADFSDAAEQLAQPRGIAGVTATVPPWLARKQGDVDRERWQELFALAGLPPPAFDCPHPGHGIYYPVGGGSETGPAYYNYGFVLGTAAAMNAIAQTIRADCQLAADFNQTDLSAQIGLTLSILRNRIHYMSLPVRYNFWAEPGYFQTYPSEAADMRIFHYLNGPFRKHDDTSGTQAVAAWLEAHRNDPNPHTKMVVGVVGKAHQAVMADLSDTL
jgi:hypothetical protein